MKHFGTLTKNPSITDESEPLYYLFVDGPVSTETENQLSAESDIHRPFIYDPNTDLSYLNRLYETTDDATFAAIQHTLIQMGYTHNPQLASRLTNTPFTIECDVEVIDDCEKYYDSVEVQIKGIDGSDHGDLWQAAIPYKGLIDLTRTAHLEDEGYLIEDDRAQATLESLKTVPFITFIENTY